MSNVGALASNLHEGSRSEYLAQYVFASFGTAISVPHQEDTGVDLYCTMTERVGKLAWPRHHYSVQVKSAMSSWKFDSPESVRWLVEHPLPLFFCVVDKSTGRIRLYHTLSRFLVWATGALPDTLELIPEDGCVGQSAQWNDGKQFSLSAPIIDRTVMELMDDDIWAKTRSVIDFWLKEEQLCLARLKIGLPISSMPSGYKTNSTDITGMIFQWSNLPDRIDDVRKTLGEILPWLAQSFYNQKDIRGVARATLLLRFLFREYEGPGTPHAPLAESAINKALGVGGQYLYEGTDLLAETIGKMLSNSQQT